MDQIQSTKRSILTLVGAIGLSVTMVAISLSARTVAAAPRRAGRRTAPTRTHREAEPRCYATA